MARVRFEKATRTYPAADKPAVNELDLTIEPGELMVMVGPSGCGKSTSLRMLAGLEDVTSGRIFIGDRDVTEASHKDRDIAMVFQTYALYPHMSVAVNMSFALKIQGIAQEEIDRRVRDAAEILHLTEFLERQPGALSGGQRQRVAIGRAIVRQPQVFLMDEPLSNLDSQLRLETRTQIASLQKKLGVTTLYVTHDQIEALTMGDRIAVLNEGTLQQVGTPKQVYENPVNKFVASFIGVPAMNIIKLPIVGSKCGTNNTNLDVPRAVLDATGGKSEVYVGVRPESIVPASPTDPEGLNVRVELVEEQGSDAYAHLAPLEPFGDATSLRMRVDTRNLPAVGQELRIKPRPEEAYFFDVETELALPAK